MSAGMKATVLAVYNTTFETMRAEKALKSAGVRVRPRIKPRSIESSCGMALEISGDSMRKASEISADMKFLGFFEETSDGWRPVSG